MYQSHMAVIGESLWSQLRTLAPMRVRPARSVLLRQGDPGTHVVLLASGSTLVTLTGPNGERALLAIRGPGELLGELAVLDAQPRSASVIAAEPCHVHLIPAPDFLSFVESNDLLNPLLRHAIARVRESEAVRLELATACVPVRLAGALHAARGRRCNESASGQCPTDSGRALPDDRCVPQRRRYGDQAVAGRGLAGDGSGRRTTDP